MLTVYCDESYTTTTHAVGGFVGGALDREAVGANLDVAAHGAVDSVSQLTDTSGGKFALAGCVAIDRASRWRGANHPAWPLEAIFDGDTVD